MVQILLRPTYSCELEACLDVRDMSAAGEHAAWVRARLICDTRTTNTIDRQREPQLAQPPDSQLDLHSFDFRRTFAPHTPPPPRDILKDTKPLTYTLKPSED